MGGKAEGFEDAVDRVFAIAQGSLFRHGEKIADVYRRGEAAHATLFFEDWDGQKMAFLYNLLILSEGFEEIFYNAPYHWKVSDGTVSVEYVEGDVYVEPSD
jgi:hypothetical protein